MAKTASEELIDLARGAVAMGVSTARRVTKDVKEALRIDLGTVLLKTYQEHRNLGYSEAKARDLTLWVAQEQLDSKIEGLKKVGQND